MNTSLRRFYVTQVKKYVPKSVFLAFNALKERLHIKFRESALAHRYLDGMQGLEIGGSAHNPFGLDTKNVDYTAETNQYKKLEEKFVGAALPFNILTLGIFTFIINGFLLWILSGVVKGFEVQGFWVAVLGALFLSVISALSQWALTASVKTAD